MDLLETTQELLSELLDFREIKFPFDYGNPFELEPKLRYYLDQFEVDPNFRDRLLDDVITELEPTIELAKKEYEGLKKYTDVFGAINSIKGIVGLVGGLVRAILDESEEEIKTKRENTPSDFVQLVDGAVHVGTSIGIQARKPELTDTISYSLFFDYSVVQLGAGMYAVLDVAFDRLADKAKNLFNAVTTFDIPFTEADDKIREKLEGTEIDDDILDKMHQVYTSQRLQNSMQNALDTPAYIFLHELVDGMIEEKVIKETLTQDYLDAKLKSYT